MDVLTPQTLALPAPDGNEQPSAGTQRGYRLVTKEEFWLVGFVSSGPFQKAPEWVEKLWETVRSRAPEFPPPVNQAAFVCPNAARETEFTYYIGGESRAELTDLPAGMVCIRIPAHTYAVGTHRGGKHDTYADLRDWFKQEGCEALPGSLRLEVYPPSFQTADELLFDVYLPVTPPVPAQAPRDTTASLWADPAEAPLLELIDHVQVPVADLEEAIAWYTRHLGFQLDQIASPELAFLYLPLGPHLLLWKTKDQSTATFTKSGETMPVIGISSRSIQKLHDQLQHARVRITHFQDEGYGIVLKFLDPDGNMFVVHQDRNPHECDIGR
jgi:predicted transcriptional regulator YdeE/catechol 2,3-dioxygenase-like lactoylglutathione lyase family enzyme